MTATKVIVVSPTRELSATLAQQLSDPRFDIVHVRPGTGLFQAVRRARPTIAVLEVFSLLANGGLGAGPGSIS